MKTHKITPMSSRILIAVALALLPVHAWAQISTAQELQRAIDTAPAYGVVEIHKTIHVRNVPINMRSLVGVTLRCVGEGKIVVRFRPAEAKDWPAIDAVGSQGLRFEVRIQSPRDADWVVMPACGMLFGRTPNPDDPDRPPSSLGHKLTDCDIGGSYSQACVYNVGSELMRIVDCSLKNEVGACYMTSCWNVKRIGSPHGEIAGGPEIGGPGRVSNVVHWLTRSHFGVGGEKPAIVMYPSGGFLNLTNCSFASRGRAPCSVYIGHRTGWTETPVPCWGGVMIGNYAEYPDWRAVDVVIATDFQHFGRTQGPTVEGYPDIMKLNPGFRRGVYRFDCAMPKFPHP